MVTWLLGEGVEAEALKAGDWTPLMLAAASKAPSAAAVADLLLEGGADVTAVNKDGWTSLHIAARTGSVRDPSTPHHRLEEKREEAVKVAVLRTLTRQLSSDERQRLARIPSKNGRTALQTAGFFRL